MDRAKTRTNAHFSSYFRQKGANCFFGGCGAFNLHSRGLLAEQRLTWSILEFGTQTDLAPGSQKAWLVVFKETSVRPGVTASAQPRNLLNRSGWKSDLKGINHKAVSYFRREVCG
jgi:hypothetical protein